VNTSKGPHGVQVEPQLVKEVRSLAHGARKVCQAFGQVSVVPVFGLRRAFRVWVGVHFSGEGVAREFAARGSWPVVHVDDDQPHHRTVN